MIVIINISLKELLLAHMLYSYLMTILFRDKLALGHHVIEIKLNKLKGLEKCKLTFNKPPIIKIDDQCKSENIKSLGN